MIRAWLLALSLLASSCGDNEKWDCTCTITCDDVSETFSADDICDSPDNASRAIDDATDECIGELEGFCTEGGCACDCETTGDSC